MFWLAEVFNGRFSEDELRRHERWAHEQRAEAVHQSLSATGSALISAAAAVSRGVKSTGTGLAVLGGKIRRRRDRRAAIRQLNALSDRMLKDIGLTRGEIPAVVNGLIDGQSRADAPVPVAPARRVVEPRSADRRETEQQWQRAA